MKKTRLLSGLLMISVVLLFFPVVLPAENAVQSKWTSSPLRVDGLNEEWPEDSMNFKKSVAVEYAFRNDDRNLYVLFIFKDPKFLSSIDTTGITLYFNTLGKKSKDYGVKFVKKMVNGDQLIAHMESQGFTLTEEKKQEIKAKPQYVLFDAAAVNKKGEEILPTEAHQGIDLPGFMIMTQQNLVAYEFRIPLASRELHPAGIGADPGKEIIVGFEWGGMTKEMKEKMQRGRGPGAVSTGADLSTERPTGTYQEQAPTGPTGPKKYSFWVDVKLAKAQ
jgi:hypothetical protein